MNVHLIVIFGRNAENSPLARAIRELGVTLTTFSNAIRLNYPHPTSRYLIGWPRLFAFSLRTAFRSLFSVPPADVIIVNSHFDIVALRFVSAISFRPLPNLVLPGFIYTEPERPGNRRLKLAYFRWVLQHVAVAICHSHLEVTANRERFPGLSNRFIYFPYAVHVSGATGFRDQTTKAKTILSAGRSGRDYPTLIAATQGLNVSLHIISDQFPNNLDISHSCNVQLLTDCYGDCFFNELLRCRFVVLPLKVNDISAGQMVLLQAMAMGKPTIISRTATTIDYARDRDGILFVSPGNVQELTRAIRRLCEDDQLCSTLGRRAAEVFEERYSITAYASHLVAAAERACHAPSALRHPQ